MLRHHVLGRDNSESRLSPVINSGLNLQVLQVLTITDCFPNQKTG